MNFGRRALSSHLKILQSKTDFRSEESFDNFCFLYSLFPLFYWTWTFLQGISILFSLLCLLRSVHSFRRFLELTSPSVQFSLPTDEKDVTWRKSPWMNICYVYRLFINMSHHLLWFHPESLWCRYIRLSMKSIGKVSNKFVEQIER